LRDAGGGVSTSIFILTTFKKKFVLIKMSDKKDPIGYVHPEQPHLPGAYQYKTINVINEKAQYQSSTKPALPYKNFSQQPEDIQEKVQRNDVCPACGEVALYRCECKQFGDQMCKNRHIWYVTREGKVVFADPHD
jgi:hypothetical protein